MPLICYICKLPFFLLKSYFAHLRLNHAMHNVGVEVQCCQESCTRSFISFRALKRHFEKEHINVLESDNDDLLPCSSQMSTGSVSVVIEQDNDQESLQNDVTTSVNLTNSFMNFTGLLQSKANISQNNIQFVVENMRVFLDDVAEHSAAKVRKLCHDLNTDTTSYVVQTCLNDMKQLPQECMGRVDSQFKRRQFLRESGTLIEPRELVLGTRTEARFASSLGCRKVTVVEDTMQYIPIELILCTILQDSGYASLISDFSIKRKTYPSHLISHFFQADTYRTHPFFLLYPDALALHLYVDGFETTNPLGSHTSVHKLEGLYLQIQNFPSESQSKLSSIFLVALWHAQDVKTYGYNNILEPVVKCLLQLESADGIVVPMHDQDVLVRAALVLISADNLGFHSLFGFFESFTTKKFCRFCECTRDSADKNFLEFKFVLRSKSSYDAAVKAIGSANHNVKETGIKRGCIFNQLKYFHVTGNYCVDGMHDLLEGVGPYEVSMVLEALVADKLLSLDDLNSAITFFNYGLSDSNSRPPTLSNTQSLRMSATEMWCFLRNLPLMIGQRVPREHEHWLLLLKLLDILDIVFAPTVTVELCSFLGHLIDEHHTYLKQLYPDKQLLPKHHFLVHYPACMMKSGPAVRYWCMRFEARHNFFKELGKVSRCYKNIAKTLATRFQFASACSMNAHDRSNLVHQQSGPSEEVAICSGFATESAEAICRSLQLCPHDTVYRLKWFSVGHYTFKRQCVVVTSLSQGIPQFGIVLELISVNLTTYVVVEVLKTRHFDDHFHAYAVAHLSDNNIACVQLSCLKDHIPLQYNLLTYEGSEHMLIAMRYTLI